MACINALRQSPHYMPSETSFQNREAVLRPERLSSLSSYGGSSQPRLCITYSRISQRSVLFSKRNRLTVSASTHASIGVHPGTEPGSHGLNAPVFEDVPHLTDYLPGLPTYPSPLIDNPAYTTGRHYFVGTEDVVARNVVTTLESPGVGPHFRRAGPREKYGVQDIIGIEGGYRGFYARNTVPLNPKIVNDIHKRGGTVLGTSRGGHDTTKIVNSIQDRGINQVYIIGGDGTQKGAAAIYEEVRKRKLKVSVVGVPKTIDNDIAVIDRSFGFDTAVEEAQRAINAAHTEAESVHNGIGLVKLMGRYSGYIAMYATLASRDVDICLIPEVPFYLEGQGGLYEFVEKRLRENGHMVIVVAEGAGQELMEGSVALDASGNRLLNDIGLWISQKLKDYYSKTKEQSLNLKYIDPTYMIRAIPSNAADNVYCTLLAQSGLHGAMAGYTGFTVGPVNGRHCFIPISRVTEKQNRVNVADRMWARLLSSTQQPAFIDAEEVNKKELKAELPGVDLKKHFAGMYTGTDSKNTNGSIASMDGAPAKAKEYPKSSSNTEKSETKQ
ncbi:hypothetical protein KP509_01G049700 [Ceratopteris richardii]|uniref:Phosphofructokinase domain-containing protein n=1 Tax=Ceratopteris richardii TaxID=49495 RepID=A0A8T2VGN6_CERRI|nr:hypothetical protein KP509_01G049700 [Ceratopteris richardii]